MPHPHHVFFSKQRSVYTLFDRFLVDVLRLNQLIADDVRIIDGCCQIGTKKHYSKPNETVNSRARLTALIACRWHTHLDRFILDVQRIDEKDRKSTRLNSSHWE